jgi:hypothetical protein
VVTLFGAPLAPRRLSRRARPRHADPEAAAPEVPLSRLTVISPDELGDTAAAAEWLRATSAEDEALDELIATAITVVNRAVHAHRAAAQDASGGDLSRGRAIALRVGYGRGDRLVDGRFDALLAEVGPEGDPGQERDLATLKERQRPVSDAADEALGGNLSAERAAAVIEALEIGERVLRRRRVMAQ